MSSGDPKLPPHVLIFPLPAQGHLNSMLNLAQLLSLSSIHVTFIVSEFIHRRLLQHTALHQSLSMYPGFQFQMITDGLPDGHPRAGLQAMDLIRSIREITGPLFKKMMVDQRLFAGAGRRPVTCIIADGVLSFAADFAEANGIPIIIFRTVSACAFWTLFCYDQVVQASDLPLKGNGMDEAVNSIPGMEGCLRRRDLPSFYRVDDPNDAGLHDLGAVSKRAARANAFILNTFHALEDTTLSNIIKHMPRLYSIGPTNLLLRSRLAQKAVASTVTSSLWAEDRRCIDWLDAQKPKSVIYVSFGSITLVTRENLLEFWHGLVNSGHKFLWVMRPDSISGKDGLEELPEELKNGTKENGYMAEWTPQDAVLNHPSVGGFLTHSGWNSTLESIAAGVPMVCWPYFADQTTNSRFVGEVWKNGLDIKDTCDREVIEKAVRKVMEAGKNEELVKRASELAKLARESISEGGSSYSNFDSLVEFIQSFVI